MLQDTHDRIKLQGLLQHGYGYIPKAVMLDRETIYIPRVDIVGNKLYFSVNGCREDDSLSYRGQQGYARNEIRVYEKDMDSNEIKFLWAY